MMINILKKNHNCSNMIINSWQAEFTIEIESDYVVKWFER